VFVKRGNYFDLAIAWRQLTSTSELIAPNCEFGAECIAMQQQLT
jgi:hypothetical protein